MERAGAGDTAIDAERFKPLLEPGADTRPDAGAGPKPVADAAAAALGPAPAPAPAAPLAAAEEGEAEAAALSVAACWKEDSHSLSDDSLSAANHHVRA
jgi:hypothetical protein